jgi:hypothetical protein
LCTAHFLWEVLMKKYVTDLTCKINITWGTNCNYTMAATIYTL